MSSIHSPHPDLIRRTRRCRDEVLRTVDKLAGIGPDEMADMAREFISNGEDSALGVLMNVCAIRQIRVPPELLPSILEVIEPIIDFGPLLAFQDAEALPFLLEAAKSEAVSIQRQAYAGLLAVEMAILHRVDPAPVRRLLRILEQSHFMNPEATAILGSAFTLLDMPEADRPPAKALISQARVIDLLPDKPPPIVIGDGGTVRRPVPKIGRNATCPCGSGKKYKKCCMGKDQQRIRDASSHEGLTRSQILAAPDLVDDVDMIEEMRSYDLKKLDPGRLNIRQLIAASRRCDLLGMRQRAFDMLLEIERRPDKGHFDRGHFFNLLHSALNTGDLELAKKIHGHVPWEQLGEKDESVWHQTKPIKRLPGCFRIRIGRDYRLMVNWQGEEALRVLDCIHRSGLESWIHRRAGA